jgi:hypothetical protein
LSFDLTVTSIFPALLSGRYVEIIPEAEGVLGLSTALARPADYSLVKLTPAHVQLLATELAASETANLSHALVIGGENLLAETVRWWREHSPQRSSSTSTARLRPSSAAASMKCNQRRVDRLNPDRKTDSEHTSLHP